MIPLAQYLTEFSDGGAIAPAAVGEPRTRHVNAEHLTLVRDGVGGPGETAGGGDGNAVSLFRHEHQNALEEAVAAARATAFAEGQADTRAALEAAHAEALAAERERARRTLAESLDAARAEWAETASTRLAADLDQRLTRFEDDVRITLNNVLRPLASNARQRQTLSQLVESVQVLLTGGRDGSISVSGPDDLLAALGDKLGARRNFVRFQSDPAARELRVEADSTVIETSLSAWRAALEEALA